jgi:hypothetical protein
VIILILYQIATKSACIFRDIYPVCIVGAVTKKCQIKEGITFANNRWNGKESLDLDGQEEAEKQVSSYENYAKERLKRPEYQRMRISLERLARTIAILEISWQRTRRHHTLRELENLLHQQHEIERDAENIEDVFLRGYIYERLDTIAAARRSLSEDVGWDIESEKKSLGI